MGLIPLVCGALLTGTDISTWRCHFIASDVQIWQHQHVYIYTYAFPYGAIDLLLQCFITASVVLPTVS